MLQPLLSSEKKNHTFSNFLQLFVSLHCPHQFVFRNIKFEVSDQNSENQIEFGGSISVKDFDKTLRKRVVNFKARDLNGKYFGTSALT